MPRLIYFLSIAPSSNNDPPEPKNCILVYLHSISRRTVASLPTITHTRPLPCFTVSSSESLVPLQFIIILWEPIMEHLWPHSSMFLLNSCQDPLFRPLWPLSLKGAQHSSPVIYDVGPFQLHVTMVQSSTLAVILPDGRADASSLQLVKGGVYV